MVRIVVLPRVPIDERAVVGEVRSDGLRRCVDRHGTLDRPRSWCARDGEGDHGRCSTQHGDDDQRGHDDGGPSGHPELRGGSGSVARRGGLGANRVSIRRQREGRARARLPRGRCSRRSTRWPCTTSSSSRPRRRTARPRRPWPAPCALSAAALLAIVVVPACASDDEAAGDRNQQAPQEPTASPKGRVDRRAAPPAPHISGRAGRPQPAPRVTCLRVGAAADARGVTWRAAAGGGAASLRTAPS
jgi:hypothetical protein